jgi:methylated-DNA-[protein]-cysteine S-methyltransferase
MSVKRWTVYESPIGPLSLAMGPNGLTDLRIADRTSPPGDTEKNSLPEVTEQLDAYFAGKLRDFDLPLDPQGTPLEKAVWRGLLDVPYGETASYGEQAAKIDPTLFDPGVEPWQRARVVGAANGRNPIAIVIPCHRVIGADGSLTGYGGGLERKRALLDLESNRQLAIL